MLGTAPKLITFKANTHPAILWLQPCGKGLDLLGVFQADLKQLRLDARTQVLGLSEATLAVLGASGAMSVRPWARVRGWLHSFGHNAESSQCLQRLITES